MGFREWWSGSYSARALTPPLNIAAPGSGDNLAAAVIGDVWGALPAEIVSVPVGLRVPELKRALKAHQALVTPLRFEQYNDNQRAEDQPYWVGHCDYPGLSRFMAVKTLVAELFWYGFGVLGCRLDTDGNVYDWVPVPNDLWRTNRDTGAIDISPEIPAAFRQRVVQVPLGDNGVIVDAADMIRQARLLDAARRVRLESPPAATELHISDAAKETTAKERANFAREYTQNRTKYAVSVTPAYLQVIERGVGQALDLFEGASGAIGRSLAMFGGVPASFVESSANGGSGTLQYQNANGQMSDLWVFGSAEYAYAIAAALSGDDVVGAGSEVRFDASAFAIPAPLIADPEAGDSTASVLEVPTHD